MNGKQNESDCGFAESMVSYMYDEIGPAESQAFESHLIDCGRCTDEFAELSTARLAMFEWNRDEFAHIVTPQFVNPALASAAPGRLAAFIEGLRGLLAPLTTAAAAVVLLLITGLGLYLNSGISSPQIASNTAKQEPVQPMATDDSFPINKPVEPQVEGEEVMSTAAATSPLPQAVRARSRKIQQVSAPSVRRPGTSQRATRTIEPGRTPVLSSFKETEDRSLRLADLFDEIGG
jgi:hypothetical protein